MKGMTFNGVHSDTLGVGVAPDSWPIVPESKDEYVDIPGRHGSYHVPGKREDFEIELECYVIGSSVENLHAKALEISAWLYSEERKILSFDVLPGKHFVAKTEDVNLEFLFTLGKFDVTFRCEPFIFDDTNQSEPFAADVATVNNAGTATAFPIFDVSFTATASEWKVTLDGNKFIRIVHSFQIGDTLYVNCSTGEISINGVNAQADLDWQNSDFFELQPGENVLDISPAGVCSADVTWNQRWL